MMEYVFSRRSYDNMRGVHPDLVACAVMALYRYSTLDFVIIEGVRSIRRHEHLQDREDPVTWTSNSKHLIQADGFGHALDIAPLINNRIPWDNRNAFRNVSQAMKFAARYLGIQIVWGGDWKSVFDGAHYEIIKGYK